MSPKTAAPKELIYIGDLAGIINREVNTIRKWERDGKLPKSLLPRRGDRGRRCWTPKQVEGIKAWMKKNDMRPGNKLTTPDQADAHVAALRRPRYLNNNMIDLVLKMINDGERSDAIIKRLYPMTRYTSPENLEAALRRYFRHQQWDFPNDNRGNSVGLKRGLPDKQNMPDAHKTRASKKRKK